MTIADVYTDPGLFAYALTLTGNPEEAKELISICALNCLEKKDKIQEIQKRGKLLQYFTVMIKNQHFKRNRDRITSVPIEDKLKPGTRLEPWQYTDPEEEPPPDPLEVKEKVEKTIQAMSLYTGQLLRMYKHDTYRGIAAKTKIPYVSVFKGVNAAKEEFKKIYNGMKIGIAFHQTGGVEYHRLFIPMLKLAQKYNAEIIGIPIRDEKNYKDKWLGDLPEGLTHLVYSRNISTLLRPELAILKLREKGIRVICDMDDYWHLPKSHILHNAYKKQNMPACMIANMQMADVVWTTHKQLAKEIEPINPNVHVVKNCIDPAEDQFALDKRKEAFDKFLWIGGWTHKHDLKLIRNAAALVDFTYMGASNHEMMKYQKEYFPNAKHLEATEVTKYAYPYLDHGVCLIPLLNNKFNRMKSELKLVEAGHFGRAVIVSDTHPYSPHVKHFKTGLKSDNKSWEKWVKRIKGDHALQADLGAALKEYVDKNYSLQRENRLRFETL